MAGQEIEIRYLRGRSRKPRIEATINPSPSGDGVYGLRVDTVGSE